MIPRGLAAGVGRVRGDADSLIFYLYGCIGFILIARRTRPLRHHPRGLLPRLPRCTLGLDRLFYTSYHGCESYGTSRPPPIACRRYGAARPSPPAPEPCDRSYACSTRCTRPPSTRRSRWRAAAAAAARRRWRARCTTRRGGSSSSSLCLLGRLHLHRSFVPLALHRRDHHRDAVAARRDEARLRRASGRPSATSCTAGSPPTAAATSCASGSARRRRRRRRRGRGGSRPLPPRRARHLAARAYLRAAAACGGWSSGPRSAPPA